MTELITTTASAITKAASKQTYYTIRFLVDRDRVDDAYRAYGYFRWVDDVLDAGSDTKRDRRSFIERQKFLLESCYKGEPLRDANHHEKILIDLVKNDHERNSGLQSYLRNMMQVMDFDAGRRNRMISQDELDLYTRWLATAITEAMHYFIGHNDFSPHDGSRYLAVSAAHITHMLRDTFDDFRSGYYNHPSELFGGFHDNHQLIQIDQYRTWVKSRVLLARDYFKKGRDYLARVQNRRCRLAGYAYTERFEWLLDTIERENFYLRPQYQERKSIGNGFRMSWFTFSSMLNLHRRKTPNMPITSHPVDDL